MQQEDVAMTQIYSGHITNSDESLTIDNVQEQDKS